MGYGYLQEIIKYNFKELRMRLKKMIKIYRQLTSTPSDEDLEVAILRWQISHFLLRLIGKKLGYKENKQEK